MTDPRPSPDALLERAREEERRSRRGKLKIFFGAAPGVGKTYAMLAAAKRLRAQGIDVVVGIVETHGRAETQEMLQGLEALPRREAHYRDRVWLDLDLDAALARRPAVLLVDELAHSNPPGSRFDKRWQDVEALLDAGISVYSTLNVQHVESLTDVVTQITDVVVRETVPDSVVEEADEVELIDLPPDALMERLRQGKVYIPDTAARALDKFFRKGNLSALRELALRRTAEWVDGQVRAYKQEKGIDRVWGASERILVCVGPGPHSANVLRAAKRLAIGLRAKVFAVYVETQSASRWPADVRDGVTHTLRLAESFDFETVTLQAPLGRTVAEELLDYARSREVSRIVVGTPAPRWRWGRRSTLDALVRGGAGMDVLVIRGEGDGDETPVQSPIVRTSGMIQYAEALGYVASATAIGGLAFLKVDLTNVAMVYLVAVVAAAVRCGRGPSVLASVVGVAAFDFFFVPPRFTFVVGDFQYVITFAVLLAVGLLIAELTARLRSEAMTARERERRTAALYSMSRELATSRDLDEIVPSATAHLREAFSAGAAVLLADEAGGLAPSSTDPAQLTLSEKDQAVARWSFDHGKPAGLGTTTLPSSAVLCIPMAASQGRVGVVAVAPREANRTFAPQQLLLLETFVHPLALAVERERLLRRAQQAQIDAETERTRSALLSSVSHDLRTPLASIQGAASALIESRDLLDPETVRELIDAIHEEAQRLRELIDNLLFATQLESGAVRAKREAVVVEEVVGVVAAHVRPRLGRRPFAVQLEPDLPLVAGDPVLLEQLLSNLVENAVRHTPDGTRIEIRARAADGSILMEILDEGPGLAPGEEQLVFRRFYRGRATSAGSGLGLGLAICEGIAKAHGGRIWAENRTPSGVAFRVLLPPWKGAA